MGCTILSKLAIDLGAECDEVGNLVVDSRQRTVIPGLYAAGDVVDEINQIAVAFGHAAVAATDMHNYLSDDRQKLAGGMILAKRCCSYTARFDAARPCMSCDAVSGNLSHAARLLNMRFTIS